MQAFSCGSGGHLDTDFASSQEMNRYSDPTWVPSLLQVVKAFVVLAPEFLSHDPDQLTKLLQQHVKSVTAPYKYPRKVRPSPAVSPVLAEERLLYVSSLACEQDF